MNTVVKTLLLLVLLNGLTSADVITSNDGAKSYQVTTSTCPIGKLCDQLSNNATGLIKLIGACNSTRGTMTVFSPDCFNRVRDGLNEMQMIYKQVNVPSGGVRSSDPATTVFALVLLGMLGQLIAQNRSRNKGNMIFCMCIILLLSREITKVKAQDDDIDVGDDDDGGGGGDDDFDGDHDGGDSNDDDPYSMSGDDELYNGVAISSYSTEYGGVIGSWSYYPVYNSYFLYWYYIYLSENHYHQPVKSSSTVTIGSTCLAQNFVNNSNTIVSVCLNILDKMENFTTSLYVNGTLPTLSSDQLSIYTNYSHGLTQCVDFLNTMCILKSGAFGKFMGATLVPYVVGMTMLVTVLINNVL